LHQQIQTILLKQVAAYPEYLGSGKSHRTRGHFRPPVPKPSMNIKEFLKKAGHPFPKKIFILSLRPHFSN
ncbi:MAG TPA: hypothetical protein VKA38_02665, partial [Draconibacterium sp.]|nr:hypothetical protein [Draconibacterium sp.]